MTKQNFTHLSDQDLLLALDGELAAEAAAAASQHLAACWSCRARRQKLESTIAAFVRSHHEAYDSQIGAGDGPRSLLCARMAQMSRHERVWSGWLTSLRSSWRVVLTACLALTAALALAPWFSHPQVVRAVTRPDPRLTPGATIVLQISQVCAAENIKNREVPDHVRNKVFEKYGLRNAPKQAYEVDYLITPALGGAEDEHNLWPHSYDSADWNASVKDQLEDFLRDQVCSGQMDLVTAQQEIAGDWIAAYKKYFHTDRPLKEIYW